MQLPTLTNHPLLAVDTETDGLNVTTGARAVGLSIAASGIEPFYVPWGHRDGENFDLDLVRDWVARELRGKTLVFLNAKFDIHALRAAGIDLEALGCSVGDVGYAAALVDSTRKSYSLDALSKSYLGRGKLQLSESFFEIHERPSEEIAEYAKTDAALTLGLHEYLQPKIEQEDLTTVLKLENDLIYVVCEMERNATPLDTTKLEQWRKEARSRYVRSIMDLHRMVGFRVVPSVPKDLARLFAAHNLEWPKTPTGQPSFTDELLTQYEEVEAIGLALSARRLVSLLSKYLDKYAHDVGPDGRLHYQLNQLRSDQYGTITGRFSSSNVNIQQVFQAEHQAARMPDFIIRELFIPPEGRIWFTADASQIEFRLFAHYSRSRRLIEAYQDPKTDFHSIVAKLTNLPRSRAKNLNFGRLYGMGRDKMARFLDTDRSESDPLYDRYDEMFPEARRLLRYASELAESRGYVKTLLGRRRRYVPGEPTFSALNSAIQGTAADIMKLKLLQLYRQRNELGVTLRFTVHDEVDGDIPPDGDVQKLEAALNEAVLPLDVPILWDLKTGPNWKETS